MPNVVDTTNEPDFIVSQRPFNERLSELGRGEDLVQGVGKWSSLIGLAGKRVNVRSQRVVRKQNDQVGEAVGKGFAGHHMTITINVGLDKYTVPQQIRTGIVSPENWVLSDANSSTTAPDSYLDYRDTEVWWIGRQSAELIEEIGMEFPWNANQTPTPNFWAFTKGLDWSSTADLHEGIKTSSSVWLDGVLEKLREMRNLKPGWDSYEAEPPNEWALKKTHEALAAFAYQRVQPDSVLPSVENGVGISVSRGEKYSFLEVLNSLEVVGVLANSKDDFKVLEVDPDNVAEAVERICAFIT